MAYPRTPGGLFPLTTAPTGNNAGGLYPLPAVLSDAIRSLAPTAYWKLDEASGNLADAMSGGYTATVTGSPTYGVAAPSPIGRGVTFATGQYGTTATSIPTPTASISLLAIFRMPANTAAVRRFGIRLGSSQNSWVFDVAGNDRIRFGTMQQGGSFHCQAQPAGSVGDGLWHVAAGTWDGSTLWAYWNTIAASSTSVTGSWYSSSTAVVTIGQDLAGALGGFAIFNDQVLSPAVIAWLTSIVKGG